MTPGDEMVDGQGGFRPHWRPLLAAIAGLGWEELSERAAALDRTFAEEGVTGLAPGDSAAAWRCDPIPLILPADEFRALEAGLAQRARLLQEILTDLYGEQCLLAEGALPPALIYGNPAFLRPCRDLAGPPLLQLYAADLLRGPDGAWRVVADRTACPTGVAHALENRRALARLIPEFFAGRALRRLEPFLDTWQDALQRLAPRPAGNPGVALLGAGPASPRRFEEIVLARELSCALVEGGDLSVRDGVVYLKTLRGLARIDVLIRRMDGAAIDPLELDPDPLPGITGLLEVARGGEVRIVNHPGTGLVEAPGLAAFLPALAERLLGETLMQPQADALWLGAPGCRAAVANDPAAWLLRRATNATVPSVRLASLSPAALAEQQRRIDAEPQAWAASAALDASLAPAAGIRGMEPQPVALRLFLVQDDGRWVALPGGLARLLPRTDPATGRTPPARLAKDVWVPAEEGEDTSGPPHLAFAPLPIRRPSGELPSRVADNFFWLGRYFERLEATARLLRAAAARVGRIAAPTPRDLAELRSLGTCLVSAGLLSAEAAGGLSTAPLAQALPRALREGGLLPNQFGQVARLAGLLRDRLSGEMQASISQGLRTLNDEARASGLYRDDPAGIARLGRVTSAMLAFGAAQAGLAAENMVRGGGWLFLDLGRRMERAANVAAWVAAAVDQPGAAAQPARLEPGLRLALELCDSAITYRSRYLTVLQPAPVLDLVLADGGNPRGLAFQLAAIRDMLTELADAPRSPLAAAAAALGDDVQAMVREIVATPMQGEATARLPARLRVVGEELATLSDTMSRRYFALLPLPQSLGLESLGLPSLGLGTT